MDANTDHGMPKQLLARGEVAAWLQIAKDIGQLEFERAGSHPLRTGSWPTAMMCTTDRS